MIGPTIYVFGAGGHGKVVADAALSNGLTLSGFLDDDPSRAGHEVLGRKVHGGFETLRRLVGEGPVAILLGVGSNPARRSVASRCQEAGATLLTIVHRTASIAPSAVLGAGTVVMAGAAVNPDARLGEGVIVNTGAVIEHDCDVGAYAHLSPNAAIGGGVRLGELVSLGLCACVLPGITVGAATVVGAGAVVTRPLPPDAVAVGVPARVIPVSRATDG
jgi:sugar O-acyltransferase (sialic acid O-acetyltransferase NeuD family)